MKKLYFGLFLAIMIIGGVSIFATKEKTFSENENRYLKTFEDLSDSETLIKTDMVEGVLADQFPFRDQWLMVASEARFIVGAREINDTYLGKDGYLFDKCDENDFGLEQYQKNLSYVKRFADSLDDNTAMRVVLVPSPYVILNDKLPSNAVVYDADEKYALLNNTLGTTAQVIDLRDTLNTLACDTQVYYRTDHHWTTRAAYAGYLTAFENQNADAASSSALAYADLKTVSNEFHGTLYSRVLLRGNVYDSIAAPIASDIDQDALYDNSKLSEKDKYAYFLGGNDGLVSFEGTGTGNLLLIKDSFANCMVPFLTEKYAHITIVDLRFLPIEMQQVLANGVDGVPYDEVTVLYEMSNFASDNNLFKLARGIK